MIECSQLLFSVCLIERSKQSIIRRRRQQQKQRQRRPHFEHDDNHSSDSNGYDACIRILQIGQCSRVRCTLTAHIIYIHFSIANSRYQIDMLYFLLHSLAKHRGKPPHNSIARDPSLENFSRTLFFSLVYKTKLLKHERARAVSSPECT